MPDSASTLLFAETAEFIAATPERNEKADRLGAYLRTLPDDDLARAARFMAGRPFSLGDRRAANVGTAALLAAIAEAAGTSADALRPRLVRLGDAGDVAAEVLPDLPPEHPSLTLADWEAAFAGLADTRGTLARTEQLADLLRQARPLEAKYLVKILSGDLRIGMKEGGVELALARMTGEPVSAIGRAGMLTGDLGETAVLARYGRLGTARMRLFHPLGFMLATAADDAVDVVRQMPERFAVEDKFDGIRAQAHVGADPGDAALHGVATAGRRVALFSRTRDGITAAFPELVEPLAALLPSAPGGLILDGEIVPVDGSRILPFQVLQKRLGRKRPSEQVRRELPVAFVVYDVLFFDGEVLLDTPYDLRRARLATLPTTDDSPIRSSIVTYLESPEEIDAAFDQARARGNEGLMVKNPSSPYRPGRRGRDWLKVKRALATLDCVVTAVEVGNGRRRHLLSDYTFAVRAGDDDPTLLNVGKAYSGLTDAELARMTEWFEAHTLQTFAHGKVRLVEPLVVVEVAFDVVQPSKRHKSGYALRFPRIVRLREDKSPDEIDTVETVARLAAVRESA